MPYTPPPPPAPPGLYLKSTLTPTEAALYCGLSERTFKRYRTNGKGPKFIRFSSHKTVYQISDLDAWKEQNKLQSLRETKPRRKKASAQA